MTRSILITLTVFLGICSLAASDSTFKNSQGDAVLFYNIFKDWLDQTNKQYGIEEMAVRFLTWKSNFDHVQDHNSKGLGFTLEMNDFADMAPEEFSALYLGFNTDLVEASKKNTYHKNKAAKYNQKNASHSGEFHKNSSLSDGLPKSVDWRKLGAVTDVKNQGQCGGCWSFSATGALEGLNAIKNKKLVSLSEQELIDCSGFLGNQGCEGGLMTNAFQFVETYGIQSAASYGFTGEDGNCGQDTSQNVFQNSGYEEVPVNDSMALKRAVSRQPVSIGIEASSLTVQLFKSGVISTNCTTNLDHGVLAVGYNVDRNGQEYFIVKNSWGPNWGLNGFFNIAMGNQNSGMGVCGINMMASYPTL